MSDYSAYDVRNMAHAKLLTAAPDLLAVCEELVNSEQYWGEDFDLSFIVAKAKAAIAKAGGTALPVLREKPRRSGRGWIAPDGGPVRLPFRWESVAVRCTGAR